MRMLLVSLLIIAGCAEHLSDDERLSRDGGKLLESNPEKAIELLTQSLEINPHAYFTFHTRALAYARVGRDREALADIARLGEYDPDLAGVLRRKLRLSAGPYTSIAEDRFKQGDYEGAIAKCDSALAYAPDWSDAWIVKAIVFQKLNEPQKVLECYDKAEQAEPNNWFIYINRAEFYQEQKQLDLALKDFTKSIELEPEKPAGYTGRAAIYSAMNEADKAADDLATALRLKAEAESKPGS